MNAIVQERGAVSVILAEVVDGLEADIDLLVNRVEHSVLARLQSAGVVPSGALQDALWTGVMVGVRDALVRLRTEGEPPDELPRGLIALAHLCRLQAPQLPDLADVWFAGQEVFWDRFDAMTKRLLDDAALRRDVLTAGREQLSGHATRMFELFRCVYQDGREGTARSNGSSLFSAVSRALGGLWVDAADLGYNLADSHVALIADRSSLLKALADHAGRQVLLVPAPADGVWGWLGGQPQLSDTELDQLVAWQRSHEGRVAFGEPAEGIAGFSASHRQALEARSLAGATGQNVVRFADVRLLIAVLRDSQLAKGLIERELGELDHPGERMAELRATLRVYLEQGQSVSATAALRRRDRKTIQRQLRAAEQLIHHYVRDRSDELLVALRASEILRRRKPLTNRAAGSAVVGLASFASPDQH